MDDIADLRSALEVVAEALLVRSEDEASETMAAAENRAATVIAKAGVRAEDITSSAESEGTRSAESVAVHELARGRREARRTVMRARSAAVERLSTAALSAVDELQHGPQYRELEDRLANLAMSALGSDAELVRNPELRGGVMTRAGLRTVDLTLPTLAERCLRDLQADLEVLWE